MIVTTERFWSKVDIGPGCWTWNGYTINGYGSFRLNQPRRMKPAHRLAYELLVGSIPDGLVIDHLCRNKLCVNPDHLEPVTIAENVLRGEGTAARNARKTHCKHGHPFDAKNTYWIPDGSGRACRTCRQRRLAEKRRARSVFVDSHPVLDWDPEKLG